MKTTISFFLAVLMILCSTILFGQESKKVEVTSMDLSGGRSALSTGLFFTTNLKKGDNTFQITLSAERIFLNSFYKLGNSGLSFGPSIGIFKNVPYMAVIGTFRPFNSKVFSTFHWAGYSFGQPDGIISANPTFLFAINTANIDVWKMRGSYTVVFFQKLPVKHVVSLRYTQNITDRFTGYTDIGYDITNKVQLLKLGLVYKFRK